MIGLLPPGDKLESFLADVRTNKRPLLVERLLASEALINPRKIRLGQQTQEEEKRIMDATGILSEAPIYIDDSPQMKVVEMRSKARRRRSSGRPGNRRRASSWTG